MRTTLQLAATVALLALAALLIYVTGWWLPAVCQDLRDTEDALTASVAEAVGNLPTAREELVEQSEAWRTTVASRLQSLEKTAGAQLGRANDSIAKVAAIAPVAQAQLEHVGPAVQAVQEQVEAAGPVLQNAVRITGQVDTALEDQLPLFVDCDHNPDCLFNRYQGSAKAFERTMQEVAKAAPAEAAAATAFAEQTAGVAADVHTFTSRVVAPKPWWKKTLTAVGGIGFAVARIFW